LRPIREALFWVLLVVALREGADVARLLNLSIHLDNEVAGAHSEVIADLRHAGLHNGTNHVGEECERVRVIRGVVVTGSGEERGKLSLSRGIHGDGLHVADGGDGLLDSDDARGHDLLLRLWRAAVPPS
jgi:hypothetical protein